MGKRLKIGNEKTNKSKIINKKKKINKEKIKKSALDEDDQNKNLENDGNNADFYLEDADAGINQDELTEKNSLSGSDSEADAGSELDFGEDDYIPSDNEEDKVEDALNKDQIHTKKYTKLQLKKIIKKCSEGSTMHIVKMLIIFTKITNQNSESVDEDDVLNKPKIISQLIKFCIKYLPEILVLKLHSINKKGEKENSLSQKASLIKKLIKRYLSALIKYLKSTENAMINLVFKYMDPISELIIHYRNFIEIFLKIGIKTWAQRHGTRTSESAYELIRNILDKKSEHFEDALKLFYVNYLEIAKAMNWRSISKINQMQEEIINILSLDLKKAYITIFTFIRKLCLQLRLTVNDKKLASIKQIYNWQFINSIKLWSNVVCKYYSNKNCEINLLAYPLIQTIIGVLRLNFVDSFFPLRIILVNLLNEISYSTGIFIPTATYLLEILESSHFKSKFREKIITVKENGNFPDINVNLKLKKEDYKHYGFVTYLLEQVIDGIMEYLSINSCNFSFPEISFGVCYNLKKAVKSILDKSFRESIKRLIECINSHSNYIENKRRESGLNLLELEKITKFEKELKSGNNLLNMIVKIKNKRRAYIESRTIQGQDKFIEI